MRVVMELIAVLALAAPMAVGDEARMSWTFDDEPAGRIAGGFTGEVGEWKVVESDRGKALAQLAKSPDAVFNVALVDGASARDLILTVRLKAIAGEDDRGGGLVWRARDAKNYYVARYNPLEDNFRVYKVVDGKRTLFQGVDIPHSPGWHTLKVVMDGDHIECSYDGRQYLDVKDATFPGPGKVGVWSKADARSHFDDLTLEHNKR